MTAADLRKQRLAEWIDSHIGTRTQKDFAADITSVTGPGWQIDYSRLGRYRAQKLQVGQTVIDHFNAYAAARKLSPVDLAPRKLGPSLEERAVIAAEAQAKAIADLVAELREWREKDRDRLAGLETNVTSLLAAVDPLGQGAGVQRVQPARQG